MVQTYQPLELNNLLNHLRETQFTGLVCCRQESPSPAQNSPSGADALGGEQCFLVFRSGQVTYGDTAMPNVSRLAELLVRDFEHSLIRTAVKLSMEQCQNPASMREFLTRLVSTKVVSWDQVEQIVQKKVEGLLKQAASRPGSISQTASGSFDICFDADEHGLNWPSLAQVLEAGALAQQASAQGLQPQATDPGLHLSAPAPDVVASAVADAGAAKPTILSVDDSPIAQNMTKRTLESICHVLLADNALNALQMLNSNDDIRLILLDVNMPGVDGLDFCRAVRSIPKFKTLPIIMLTANEGRVNKLKGQIAGATLYLNKSVGEQKLIEVVQEYTASRFSPDSSDSASDSDRSPSYSLA